MFEKIEPNGTPTIMASMHRNIRFTQAEAETGVLHGINTKVAVGGETGYDVYVILSYTSKRFVHIDIRLSLTRAADKQRGPQSDHVSHVEAALEIISRQASILLSSGLWTITDVIEAWSGTHIYHPGRCHALPSIDGVHQYATGALDAVARRLREMLPSLDRMIDAA